MKHIHLTFLILNFSLIGAMDPKQKNARARTTDKEILQDTDYRRLKEKFDQVTGILLELGNTKSNNYPTDFEVEKYKEIVARSKFSGLIPQRKSEILKFYIFKQRVKTQLPKYYSRLKDFHKVISQNAKRHNTPEFRELERQSKQFLESLSKPKR